MAATLCACGHRASTPDRADADSVSIAADKDDSAAKPALVLDTIQIERSDSMAEVSIDVHWPVDGNEALVKSVRKYICEVLNIDEETFSGTKKAFNDIAEMKYNDLIEGWNESYEDEGGMSFSSSTTAVMQVETPTFVTYHVEHATYTGGAHGMYALMGHTFRKSDGQEIGYKTDFDNKTFEAKMMDNNLLKDTNSAKLYALIKDGVLRYFNKNGQEMENEKELADFLDVDDINRIPLPIYPPYLTETGVVFCYTLYEIGPYAAGMITFEIPYEQMKPFLTDEAIALIPGK